MEFIDRIDEQQREEMYDLGPDDRLMSGGYDWSWAFVVFRDVPDFPGYAIGSNGTTWSRFIKGSRSSRLSSWKPLKPYQRGNEYLRIGLGKNGKTHTLYIHQLMMLLFFGPGDEGREVCHNNGDCTDNRIDNIRWDTRSGNQRDRVEHGTDSRGSKHPMAKLNEADVIVIRRLKKEGWTIQAISERYGVSRLPISLLLSGKTWKHVPID